MPSLQGANEAKDNVKYLSTLEKFVDPLYVCDPVAIIDTLPALLNSLKMIHTIARYARSESMRSVNSERATQRTGVGR